jgi:hypothetical protein
MSNDNFMNLRYLHTHETFKESRRHAAVATALKHKRGHQLPVLPNRKDAGSLVLWVNSAKRRLTTWLQAGGPNMPLQWSLEFRFGAGSTTMPRRWRWNVSRTPLEHINTSQTAA